MFYMRDFMRLSTTCLTVAVWVASLAPMALCDDAAVSPQLEFFEKKVRPLLVAHCYECHSANDVKGGLLLDSAAGWQKGGDSGIAIVPFEPNSSRLIEAVRYGNEDLQMPPTGRLSPQDIETLEQWVAQGAIDPRDSAAAPAHAPLVGMSIEEGRKFWSMTPIQIQKVPEPKQSEWVRTPIDAFVLSGLESANLQPAPQADNRTLIRRATFDLTGLPPSAAEVTAFLEDESEDAYSRLIDRLLQSADYGVRWGRHWLDVARYADSNGLDENLAFGNAWRYRDYVVDAFNNDKPFDRFLKEQIAGDLLPDVTIESRIATGFLVLGAKVLAEPDREKLDMDTIDEQLDSTGKAFMGMTFGCARCHDHKFDPIKQSDYYSLAAIFRSTKTFGDTNLGAIKHWNEYSFASEEEKAALKKVDEEVAAKKSAAASYKAEATNRLRINVREKASVYLTAAAKIDPDTSLNELKTLAEPLGLHPRVLHHCRQHLKFHSDDPLFRKWRELQAVGDFEGIQQHYSTLFASADAALATVKAADAAATSSGDSALDAVRAAVDDPSGFLALPPKPEFALDETTLAEFHRLSEIARVVESRAADESSAMSVSDGAVLTSLPICVRGNHRNLGDAVPRDFPPVMKPDDSVMVLPENQSGRLQLAEWMATPDHPLTARVIVNRIWRWHFGRGLVASTDNFGVLGDKPSNPQLLDWLAYEFSHSGWSIKALHRLIMTSNAYQMDSQHPHSAEFSVVDPEVELLWRFRRQRLDAEQIRDSVLLISGRLEKQLGGKTVPLRNRQFVFDHTSIDHTKYDSLRRAIYLPVIRNNLYTMFEQFDFPDPTMPTGNRNATVVAPQALLMMNSELVIESADAMARHLLEDRSDPVHRIELGYIRALSRAPTDAEVRQALDFVLLLAPLSSSNDASEESQRQTELHAWSLFCQTLMASNEFIYVR
jgi:mono/diheme cytochrome c family protein